MFAFVLFVFRFIEFPLILLSLCDAWSVANVLIAMKVFSTVNTRQNIAIVTVILIVLFYLSFPHSLTARITNKRDHFVTKFLGFHTDHVYSFAQVLMPANSILYYTTYFIKFSFTASVLRAKQQNSENPSKSKEILH